MTTPALTIRRSTELDRRALRRLAVLDSGLYDGTTTMLLAEQDGELIAAVPVGGEGRVFANPFVPTDGIVALLKLRAAQVRNEAAARGARSIAGRASHVLAAALVIR